MNTSHAAVTAAQLQQIPALSKLTMPQLEALAPLILQRTYDPNQLIFLEGEESRGMWFVAAGRVKIMKQSMNGRIQALCVMSTGKCFGSCPLFNMELNPATAQAIDPVTLFILPESGVESLAARDSQLVSILLVIYSQRLSHLARVSELLATWSVQDRVNDCLLSHARHQQEVIAVELTHEKLASLSGTVREVVSRHLMALEKRGLIRCERGRIILLDLGSLTPPCFFESESAAPDVI